MIEETPPGSKTACVRTTTKQHRSRDLDEPTRLTPSSRSRASPLETSDPATDRLHDPL
jgi:hypothetical protein